MEDAKDIFDSEYELKSDSDEDERNSGTPWIRDTPQRHLEELPVEKKKHIGVFTVLSSKLSHLSVLLDLTLLWLAEFISCGNSSSVVEREIL